MKNRKNYTVLALMSLVGALTVIISGCNSSSTGAANTTDYNLRGVLVQEMNHDDAHLAVWFERNDTTLTGASVRLGAAATAFWASHFGVDSAYQATIRPAATFAGDDAYLSAADGSDFSDSLLIPVADTFSITDNFQPANRLLQGLGQVSLEWTASPNAAGYVLAAVKAGQEYMGVGYSAPAASVTTAGTIPPEAFQNPVSLEPDTGLYNIYVYAMSGAPDAELAAYFLPTPLPSQKADNIDKSDFTGRFGTVTVALKDTVRVVVSTR